MTSGNQIIGICGLCGGDVKGFIGAWWGVIPPPPPRCTKCGATPIRHRGPVIPMEQPGTLYETRCTFTGDQDNSIGDNWEINPHRQSQQEYFGK